MRQGKTRGPSVRVLERRTFVFALRKTGASYQRICDTAWQHFGNSLPRSYDRRHVCEDVLLVLREMQTELEETAALVKQLELERLDAMQLGLWPRATSGDVRGVLAVLRLMERRSKLLGLDGPWKIAQTTSKEHDLPPPEEYFSEEYVNEVCKLLALHGQLLLSTNGTTDHGPEEMEGC